MSWNSVECHPSVKKYLIRSIEKGMIGGTNLIYGPTGAGQVSVARALAQTFLCERMNDDFCGECPTCFRVQHKTYADLLEFRPKKATYLIEQLRQMQYSAVMQPYQGDKKIFILHDAHRMNKESANSLLKILEEPYEHNIFLLLTDNVTGILPTIVSRCRKIRLAPLPIHDLQKRLGEKLPETEAETLARASGGLPEMAEALQESNYLQTRDTILGWLESIRKRESDVYDIVNKMAKKTSQEKEGEEHTDPELYFLDSPDLTKREKDRLLEKYYLRKHLTIILRLIRDGILLLSGCETAPFLNTDKRESLQKLWQGEKPELLIRKFEITLEAIEGIDKNLNTSILLSDLLLALRSS